MTLQTQSDAVRQTFKWCCDFKAELVSCSWSYCVVWIMIDESSQTQAPLNAPQPPLNNQTKNMSRNVLWIILEIRMRWWSLSYTMNGFWGKALTDYLQPFSLSSSFPSHSVSFVSLPKTKNCPCRLQEQLLFEDTWPMAWNANCNLFLNTF